MIRKRLIVFFLTIIKITVGKKKLRINVKYLCSKNKEGALISNDKIHNEVINVIRKYIIERSN